MKFLSTLALCLFALGFYAQPANDNCSTAIPVQVGAPGVCTPSSFTNADATDMASDPAPTCANYQGGDLWFSITVPTNGIVILELSQDGDAIDMGMSVYSGSCDALTQIDCDDDDGEGLYSLIELSGQTAGEVLFVRAWEYGNDVVGTFNFCAYEPPLCNPLENFNAYNVGTDFIDVSWSSINANASYTVEYGETGFDLGTGMTATGATGVDGPPVNISGLTPDTPYDFYVFELCEDAMNTDTLFATFSTVIDPPFNDLCSAALPIQVGGPGVCNSITLNNGNATASGADPAPDCFGYNGADVWVQLTIPASGAVFVETSMDTSAVNTVIEVYTGTCDALVYVDCDNNSSLDGNFSLLQLSGLPAGETLFVRAWNSFSTNEISFNLCAYEPPLCNLITGLSLDSAATDLIVVDWATQNIDANYTVIYGETGFDISTGTTITGASGVDGPPVTIPGLSTGTAYDVYVYETCQDAMLTDTLVSSFFTAFDPPVNDFCADAVSIQVGAPGVCTPAGFATNGATDSESTPAPTCAFYNGGDVWFQVVVPAGGVVILETSENVTGIDTGMEAYSGPCTDLTSLGCNDDGGAGLYSLLELTGLTEGETIFVRVWEYGNDNQGPFNFCAYQAPLCNPIEAFAVDSAAFDFLSITWTSVNVDASFVLEYGETGFTLGDGTIVTGATGVDGPPVDAPGLTDGTSYDFYVYEVCQDGMLTDTLTSTFNTLFLPPGNDNLCDAIPVVVDAPEVSMSNQGATSETDEPTGSCWLFAASPINSVWASFVAPAGGVVTVSTDFGSNEMEDTHITVFDLPGGDCAVLSDLVELGCDEDGGFQGAFGYTSIAVVEELVEGQTYFVQIDGYNTAAGQFFLQIFSTAVSVEELEISSLQVYPNPAQESVFVDASAVSAMVAIDLFDINGKAAISQQNVVTTNGTIEINVSALEAGVYVVRVLGDGAQAFERIVVE